MKVKEFLEILKKLDQEKDIIFQILSPSDANEFYVSPRKYNEILSDETVIVIDTI